MSLNIGHITEEITATGFSVHQDAHIGTLVDRIIDKKYENYSEETLNLFNVAVLQNEVSEDPRGRALLTLC
jgi:hypothetical protein